MPITINWPGTAEELQKQFGLKGGIRLSSDEIVVPVAVVGDLEEGPWASSQGCGTHQTQAAVAANFSYVAVLPALGTVLRVDTIMVINQTAATVDFAIRILDPADLAALTVNATVNLNNFQHPVDDSGAVNRLGSTVIRAEHTLQVGNRISLGDIPVETTQDYALAQPIFLDGNAKGGIGALAVMGTTLNIVTSAAFICREYRHRG